MSFSILGRFDTFLLGMKSQIIGNLASQEKAKLELSKTISKMTTDFRNVYDGLIPNIHAIDLNNISNIISNDIVKNPEKYIRNITDFTNPSFAGDYGPVNKPITTPLDRQNLKISDSFLKTLRTNIRTKIKNYHNSILNETDPLTYLNNAIEKDVNLVIEYLDNPNLSDEFKSRQVFNLGHKTRQEISKIFGLKNLIGIPSSNVGLGDNYLVFFGKSFSAMVTKINKEVNDSISDTINNSTNLKNNFTSGGSSVGRIIHFGHSAIRPKSKGEITEGINVLFNSPGFLKTAFNAVNGSSNNIPDLGITYVKKTGHLKHSLLIDKDINSSMGAIMKIGISFTQDQIFNINLGMAPAESRESGKAEGKTKLSSTILNRNLAETALKIMFPDPKDTLYGSSSPTLIELSIDKLVSTLSGRAPKYRPKHSSKSQGSIAIPTLVKAKTAVKKVPKPKLTVVGATNIPSSSSGPNFTVSNQGEQYSLVNLQNLINSQLQETIRKNMGTGRSSNVLNYRSGRFAASVQLERLTQSREGMITAFYSYMKNPYQTFEPGFAQGTPESRSPKLLITKSIREIAAAQVTSQLRAVSI